jgi:DNA-binding MarR family transcriptional regulator
VRVPGDYRYYTDTHPYPSDPREQAIDPASPALAVIERETAVLIRHFELLHRRSELPGGLDRASYLLLRTLHDCGPMDINGLAASLGLDPSTAGRQVCVLKDAGLVERSPAPEDRRRSIITPTGEGLRQMEAVRDRRTENLAELLAGWSAGDLETLGAMFDRYNRAIAAKYLTGSADGADRPAVPRSA